MRNFGDLQRAAREMQERLARTQQELAETTVEGTAGGGAVTVLVTGDQEIKSVRIDPGVVETKDVEMLQDLVLAAFGDALRKSKELAAERLGSITGGLNLPGLP